MQMKHVKMQVEVELVWDDSSLVDRVSADPAKEAKRLFLRELDNLQLNWGIDVRRAEEIIDGKVQHEVESP